MNWKQYTAALMIPGMLFLAGCGAGGNTAANKPQQSQQAQSGQVINGPEKVYAVYSNMRVANNYENLSGVVSNKGKMVLPLGKDSCSVITDMLTGEQKLIQQNAQVGVEEHHGEWNDYALPVYEYHWYDISGNPMENPENRRMMNLAGNCVLYADNEYNTYLYNLATGDKLLEEPVFWMEVLGDKALTVHGEEVEWVTAWNSDATIAWQVNGHLQMVKDGYVVISSNETGKFSLWNADGEAVLDDMDYMRLEDEPGYVTVTKDGFAKVYDLNESNTQPKFAIYGTRADGAVEISGGYPTDDALMSIQRADQYGMVFQWNETDDWMLGYRMQRRDYNGEPVSEVYNNITSYDTLPGYYMAYNYYPDMDRDISLIDKDGNVLATNLNYDAHQLTETTLVNEEKLVDLDGNVLTGDREYYYIYPLYTGKNKEANKLLTAEYAQDTTFLTDLLDYEGNVVIPRLRSVVYLDENLLWVEKGFYHGLMDMQGNWIYKESSFLSDADE